MPISPLTPGAFRATNSARVLTETRLQLDDLQRQLATRKKSETYGGLGAARITALDMRAKLSEVQGYRETIISFQFRARQLDLNLTAIGKVSDDLRSYAVMPQYDLDALGKTTMQKHFVTRLDEAIDMLNWQSNGVHIFGGRKTDQKPVLDSQTMLYGDSAGRAGVSQMIAERKAADFGTAPNVGRITQGGAGTAATLTEDGVHPFGFKLSAASSTSPVPASTWRRCPRLARKCASSSRCPTARRRPLRSPRAPHRCPRPRMQATSRSVRRRPPRQPICAPPSPP
jgi:flagellar hook-associated protein 3 FlgL